jgi:hypothetical protein
MQTGWFSCGSALSSPASNLVQDIFLELAVFNIKKFVQGGLALMLCTCIWNVFGWNVFPGTLCLETCFRFSSVTIKSCSRTLVMQRALPYMSFPPHASYHSTLQSVIFKRVVKLPNER